MGYILNLEEKKKVLSPSHTIDLKPITVMAFILSIFRHPLHLYYIIIIIIINNMILLLSSKLAIVILLMPLFCLLLVGEGGDGNFLG